MILKTTFLDGKITLMGGDCIEAMASMPDNSVDSIVCDPPYHLTAGKGGASGFMGKAWDGGDIAFRAETWVHALRVLKPGGHLVSFSSTRTYHRMVCAIEDAGFDIRDMICYHYGSGFPKSHSVSKAIDKVAEAVRAKSITIPMVKKGEVGEISSNRRCADCGKARASRNPCICVRLENIAITDAAKQWDGFGTALKPATEPICLARKPLVGTVVENVLMHGTGALNIDGCRIGAGEIRPIHEPTFRSGNVFGSGLEESRCTGETQTIGRWPANIIHDGSDEVLTLFPVTTSGSFNGIRKGHQSDALGKMAGGTFSEYDANSGSAARFFYSSKADSDDRLGSKHPTVKPLDLMQWLVRLVTPPSGTCLDIFAGTGTTGEAAWREGMRAILIEREPEYQADIARRMELATNPTKRSAVAKTKNNLDDPESTPLFAWQGAAE